jgi:integrase/recombinase XerD
VEAVEVFGFDRIAAAKTSAPETVPAFVEAYENSRFQVRPEEANVPAERKPSDVTNLVDLIRIWLQSKSSSTKRIYLRTLGYFLSYAGEPVEKITDSHLQAYQADLEKGTILPTGKPVGKEDTPAAPATISRVLATLKSFFNLATKARFIDVNPTRFVELPKVPGDKTKRYMERDLVEMLIEQATTLRDEALLTTLYFGGFRRSELATLRWKHVSERQDFGRPAGQITVLGKGQKRRTVVVGTRCWTVLSRLRRHERAKGRGWDEDPVFRSQKKKGGPDEEPSDRPLGPQGIYHVVKRCARRANIPSRQATRISPHWFRHAHISHMIQRGEDLFQVADNVGHANIQTTRGYAHARPDSAPGLALDDAGQDGAAQDGRAQDRAEEGGVPDD